MQIEDFSFFLWEYPQSYLLLLPTIYLPIRLLGASVFMQQFKTNIWSLKTNKQADWKWVRRLVLIWTVTQVQNIFFCLEKNYQSTTKKPFFFLDLWSCFYLLCTWDCFWKVTIISSWQNIRTTRSFCPIKQRSICSRSSETILDTLHLTKAN